MSTANIFSIQTTDKRDDLTVNHVGSCSLNADHTDTTVITINDTQYLLGYNSGSGKIDSYVLSDSEPFLSPVENSFELGKDWDKIESFYMANQPYLLAYQSKNGHMYFFPVNENLSNHHPLHFYHTRYPFTTDLTEVKPLVSQGQVFVLGYNHLDGSVNIWTVSATATSSGNLPPLAVDVVWAHQWAKGWVRFAFFTWGNENYFLKTNDWKPNVNIDHIWDDLAKGTNEVGSHLKLKDDQSLNIVHPFYVGPGDPYFLTYLASSGESNFNRVHGDCLGWSTCATITAPKDSTDIIPYRIGDVNFAVYVTK